MLFSCYFFLIIVLFLIIFLLLFSFLIIVLFLVVIFFSNNRFVFLFFSFLITVLFLVIFFSNNSFSCFLVAVERNRPGRRWCDIGGGIQASAHQVPGFRAQFSVQFIRSEIWRLFSIYILLYDFSQF